MRVIRRTARSAKARSRATALGPPERSYFDGADFRYRMGCGDLDCFLQAVAFDDVEAADDLFRFGEGAVGDELLAVAEADRSCAARRGEAVARHPHTPPLQVVEPRKAFGLPLARLRLFLRVHPLGIPRHQQHEFHRSLLSSRVDTPLRRRRGAGIDIY